MLVKLLRVLSLELLPCRCAVFAILEHIKYSSGLSVIPGIKVVQFAVRALHPGVSAIETIDQ